MTRIIDLISNKEYVAIIVSANNNVVVDGVIAVDTIDEYDDTIILQAGDLNINIPVNADILEMEDGALKLSYEPFEIVIM